MRIVSAKTGKLPLYAPKIGVGVDDGAFGVRLASGSPSSRANQLVRLDARTGRPSGEPITLPFPPERGRGLQGRRLGRRSSPATSSPDQLLKLDPKTGQTLATRLLPVRDHVADDEPDRALGRRPPPRARPARRPQDRRGRSRRSASATTAARTSSTTAAALWIATPEDNTVYKLATGDRRARSRSASASSRASSRSADGVVYVTNYNSSDLYTIDAKSLARRRRAARGSPVNPFSLAVDDDRTLWVGSPPENR